MTSERSELQRESERARLSAGEIVKRLRDQRSKSGETGYARCAAAAYLDILCVYVARSSLILLDDVVRLTRYRCFGLLLRAVVVRDPPFAPRGLRKFRM